MDKEALARPVICVFQDCIMCGDRGKKLKATIAKNNLNIRKVSFASDEGKELIHRAVFEHQIATMPFFTDGKRFSTRLNDLINVEMEKCEKPAKKRRKNVKGAKNGLAN